MSLPCCKETKQPADEHRYLLETSAFTAESSGALQTKFGTTEERILYFQSRIEEEPWTAAHFVHVVTGGCVVLDSAFYKGSREGAGRVLREQLHAWVAGLVQTAFISLVMKVDGEGTDYGKYSLRDHVSPLFLLYSI